MNGPASNVVRTLSAAALAMSVLASVTRAQESAKPAASADTSTAESAAVGPFARGPMKGVLGAIAGVQVGSGCGFADAEGTKMFLTMTQNPTSGDEKGTVLCEILTATGDTTEWFAVFEYDEIGYVKDDEKEALDGDAILKSLREGNEAGNEMRRERGWAALELVGWEKAPYYDPATNNLTWATRVRSSEGGESINHSVRLLGRNGVMKVDLVVAPEAYAGSLPEFNGLVASHAFNAGLTYGEWREGDKVAAYGLTALVAGGAGALALKSGLLGKFWKLIAGVGIALVAGFKKLFGKKDQASA